MSKIMRYWHPRCIRQGSGQRRLAHLNKIMEESLMKEVLVEVWAGTVRNGNGSHDNSEASKAKSRSTHWNLERSCSCRKGDSQ